MHGILTIKDGKRGRLSRKLQGNGKSLNPHMQQSAIRKRPNGRNSVGLESSKEVMAIELQEDIHINVASESHTQENKCGVSWMDALINA